MSDIMNALIISSNGMRAQGTRIRVVSENVANAETTGLTPGADPYTRQTVSFKNELDRQLGVSLVEVGDIGTDTSAPYTLEYKPDHPAADETGYVKMPNVNMMMELMDIREAQRSYEANLGIMEQSRTMISKTIDLLRV
ncbi:MAG: flagellar basal body rod protein FlgC [Alphaproteobacteria bacterium]